MSHLGDRITALVDQRLDPASREQVLCHLLGCPDCRAEADAERAVRRMLAGFGYGSGHEPPAALQARLLVVADEQERGGAGVRHTLSFTRRRNGTGRGRQPWDRRPGAPPSRRRTRRRFVLAGSLSIGAATAAVAFVVGGQPSGPSISPSVGSYTVEHVAVRDSGPLTDPASGAFAVVSQGPRP
ncbi:MAG: zf-HC2 domain-containing protein [Streptosporangiales bacterium]|nr:zf-HC2 domain-containing protein [Streptosporangiales bacterium]